MIPISYHTNLYSHAPGSPNSKIKPELGLSFEESNAMVDEMHDRVRDTIETTRNEQETIRSNIYQFVERQQAKDNFDAYMDSSNDDGYAFSNNIRRMSESIKSNYTTELILSSAEAKQELSLADKLYDRYQDFVGERPSIQPLIDDRA